METGQLSINSENILPIIKKWLYSDKDIFIREMVSNASDAITKHDKLVRMEEASIGADEKYKIEVIVDKKNRKLIFGDNGIGMDADEVRQYITQIAFSGAQDFISKYEEKGGADIIGHFGLGFYSAFMVSEKVEIETLSYKENAVPVKWTCEGGTEYQMEDGERTERGTTITLFISNDEKEFLEEYEVRKVLRKYCSFMAHEIFLTNAEPPAKKDGDEENEPEEPKPINNTSPLWLKQAKDCTDEEYKAFYRDVFVDFSEPLFWIHLNMDYPLRLRGILYFPRIKSDLELVEGQVKLYNNQVYVADNIKEVIPEFLLLLKGVMDCPDLPLNVSRSFLQNDGYAKKMSSYIIKKVADKLKSVYKKQKDEYEGFWDDISVFIKYGCIKERSFYDKVKDVLLFKSINGDYITLAEYLEKNKDSGEKKVYYVSDEKLQSQYIKMFKDNGQEAFILNSTIDNPFISFLESAERSFTFNRIDSYVSESIKEKDENADEQNKEMKEELEKLFTESLGLEKLEIAVENLKTSSISAIMTVDEYARRMGEMSKMFGGMDFGQSAKETLVINSNNSLVQKLMEIKGDEAQKENVELICGHIYDLAQMGQKPLEPEAMTRFIERSNTILEKLVR